MGLVYAEIELINGGDIEMVSRHLMDKEEVRHMHVTMLVDSGAYMMAINETMQEILQFRSKGKRKVRMADDSTMEFEVVGPIEVKFMNRTATCNAFVLPGDSEPLLGVIPMEEMDVVILPLQQKLVVNPDNPDYAVLKMK